MNLISISKLSLCNIYIVAIVLLNFTLKSIAKPSPFCKKNEDCDVYVEKRYCGDRGTGKKMCELCPEVGRACNGNSNCISKCQDPVSTTSLPQMSTTGQTAITTKTQKVPKTLGHVAGLYIALPISVIVAVGVLVVLGIYLYRKFKNNNTQKDLTPVEETATKDINGNNTSISELVTNGATPKNRSSGNQQNIQNKNSCDQDQSGTDGSESESLLSSESQQNVRNSFPCFPPASNAPERMTSSRDSPERYSTDMTSSENSPRHSGASGFSVIGHVIPVNTSLNMDSLDIPPTAEELGQQNIQKDSDKMKWQRSNGRPQTRT